MSIAQNVSSGLVQGSFIRKMFEEGIVLKKKYGSDQVFDLTIGNPILEPPERFKLELKNLVENPSPGMHRYMENAGYPETRVAVAHQLAKDTGVQFTQNEIVMTVGTAGALNTVFKTLLDPGEEIITFAPYFFEYAAYASNHGGSIKVLPFLKDLTPDLSALESGISMKTKAVIINSPNNPTGIVYTAAVLKQIADVVERKSREMKKRIYIITDDVYSKLYYGEGSCPRIINYYPHSIIATSFSKDLSLPGERIGYVAVNPDCEDAQDIVNGVIYSNRVLGYVNAPALMQNVVRHLLNVSVSINEYVGKRDFLYSNLKSLGYIMVKPMGAFYIFPQSPIKDDLAFVDELKKLRVLVVPGTPFAAPGYFRISYCMDDDTIRGSLPGFRHMAQKYGLKAEQGGS